MIKAKEGKCSDCPRVTRLIAGRCQTCYWKNRTILKQSEREVKVACSVKNKSYRIAKLSSKRKAQNVLYLKKRRIFMDQNTNCQAKLKGCTGKSTELHHRKGRLGELIHDHRYFLAVCSNCHSIITEHSKLAFEKGLSLLRYGS